MELKDPSSVLIDKLIISSIEITEIKDISSLVAEDIIQISTSPYRYTLPDGTQFSHLEIKEDGIINRFTAGVKGSNKFVQKYCILELCINDEDNLNCYTYHRYVDELRHIMYHLEEKYGIVADFTDIKIKYIELNRTFITDYPFRQYHRILNLFMVNLPKTFKFNNIGRQGEIQKMYYGTTKKGNTDRYRTIKIYDKTSDLKDRKKKEVKENVMRVELVLSDTSVIERAFGTAKFFELNGRTMEKYYDNQITKMIINRIKNWEKNRRKRLEKVIDRIKERHTHWKVHLLRYLQNRENEVGEILILNINDLYPLFEDEKDRKKRYNIRKGLKKHACEEEKSLNRRDDLKMQELFNRMLPCQKYDA